MLVQVKVYRKSPNEGCPDVDMYSVYTKDADEGEPVVRSTFAVREQGLVLVDEDGETTVIDDLEGATQALVGPAIVWPASKVKVM